MHEASHRRSFGPIQPLRAVLATALLAVILACAGTQAPGTANYANVESCKRYVNAYNEASCNAIELDEESLCPATLDTEHCNLAPFLDCLAGAVKCDGDFLDLDGQGDCKMPLCN